MRRRRKVRKFRVIILLLITLALVWMGMVATGIWKKIIDQYEAMNTTIITGVIEYNQHPDYPTGCESVALYILLDYYNIDVTVDDIIAELPKGPVPYEQNGVTYGANPEREFVGSPLDANSYGVFNQPIADVAEKFKSGVITKTGATVDDIVKIIDGGNPVMVWYVIDPDVKIEYRRSWIDYETGETVSWPAGEHAVVIYGHDRNNLFYSDPNTGSSCAISIKHFKYAFNSLGGRVVYYNE